MAIICAISFGYYTYRYVTKKDYAYRNVDLMSAILFLIGLLINCSALI